MSTIGNIRIQRQEAVAAKTSIGVRTTAENKESARSLSNCDNLKFKNYTVAKGDNLWNISKNELGNPLKWPNVFEANKEQIKNPHLIYPGQVFKLPTEECEAPQQPTPPTQPAEPPVSHPPENPPVNNPPAEEPKPPVTNPPDNGNNIGPAPVKKNYGKVALIGGAIGTTATAATLIGITKSLAYPASNLGGYATAQLVAKGLKGIGLAVPSGPALTKMVAQVGGPKAAGTIAAVGVGVAVAGAAVGGYYLYNKMTDK